MLPHRHSLARVALPILLLASLASTRATVSLPPVISDNMVLLRDAKVHLWGKAAAGEKIAISLGEAKTEVTADPQGKWSAHLENLKAGGPFTLNIQGNNTLAVKNVLVGEVWFASGQSNMGFPLRNSGATAEIAQANFPEIRFFSTLKTVAAEPAESIAGKWIVCSPAQAGSFAAVPYYFAKDIHQRLKVPVGMVVSASGGTDIESWVRRAEYDSRPDLASARARWAEDVKKFPATKEKYDKEYAAWKEEADKITASGGRPTKGPPREPRGPGTFWEPGSLYNGMIAPLSPFTVRGFLWYQGENNTNNGLGYAPLLKALIESWRAQWGLGDLPFLIMQLPGCRKATPEPSESGWAELRESQQKALKLPNTGMAVTLDLGLKAKGDLHPLDKTEFTRRLVLQAMNLVYGDKETVAFGPVFREATTKGGAMQITFDHIGGGLVTPENAPIKGFAIAGADHKFHWADAKIEGDSVVVSSAKVTAPVAVRYGWADLSDANLFNKEGLPAAPFRTDNWPRAGQVAAEPAE